MHGSSSPPNMYAVILRLVLVDDWTPNEPIPQSVYPEPPRPTPECLYRAMSKQRLT